MYVKNGSVWGDVLCAKAQNVLQHPWSSRYRHTHTPGAGAHTGHGLTDISV